jgi:hypothetical protein
LIDQDGRVLLVNGARWGLAGGNQGQAMYAKSPVFETDVYDPKAPAGKRWSSLAKASQKRLYHSGALLLETGHVITSGSEMDNHDDFWPESTRKKNCFPVVEEACTLPFNYRIERFEPPYIVDTRPTIATDPGSVVYGSLLAITANGDVDRFTFVRTATTTHSTNTDQRFIELVVEARRGNRYFVRFPDNSGLAPPGYWMLFAVGKDGSVSEAKVVLLKFGVKQEDDKSFSVGNNVWVIISVFLGGFGLMLL